ncbi:MAG: FHA domain-containing protein [Planctomycetes bacterium]|nr:FHA domain-containing protein [Planctomycetota bacterium]
MSAQHVGKLAACPACNGPVRIVAATATENLKLGGKFVIETGPRRVGEQIFLGGNDPLEIGKGPDSHLRLRCSSVSRQHCRLVPRANGWRLEDRNSTNGLFVNNRRISEHSLCDGDVVRIGEFELRYGLGDADTSDLSAAPIPVGASVDTHADFDGLALEQTAAAPLGLSDSAVIEAETESDAFTFIDDGISNAGHTSSSRRSDAATGPTTCPHCSAPLATDAQICVRCGHDLRTGRRVNSAAASIRTDELGKQGGIGPYLKDCLQSVAFVSEPGNMISFIFVALLALFGAILGAMSGVFLMGLIMLVGYFLVLGLLFAFLFNVILNAASGDSDLPDIGLTGDWIEDTVGPLFKFVASWLFVLAPAIMYARSMGNPVLGFQGSSPSVLGVILCVGVFFWPITILVLSLGGISCLFRPDQIALTVARTFVPYLVTCFVTAMAFGISWVLEFALPAVAVTLGGNEIAIAVCLWLLNIYAWIVAMRCIGLYYFHFKKRFAWSWG